MTSNNAFNKAIKPANDIEGVRRSAFWHLGRRDHSETELRKKLARKSENQHWIDSVIEECFEYGYLDDTRFIANFIRTCQAKGFGSARIQQDLQRKGISYDKINMALNALDYDYIPSAVHLLNAKYAQCIANPHLKQKAMVFLQGKGHSFDDIFKAIDIHNETHPEDKLESINDAISLLVRKFKVPIIDHKTKDKALRFLVSRGYSFSECLAAIKEHNQHLDDEK